MPCPERIMRLAVALSADTNTGTPESKRPENSYNSRNYIKPLSSSDVPLELKLLFILVQQVLPAAQGSQVLIVIVVKN